MTTTQEESIVIDTPEGIAYFRLLAIKHGLSIEINTGMKMSRGSLLTVINNQFGTSFKKKALALTFITGVCEYMAGERDTLPEVAGMEWGVGA
jgi:hypothetical protein